MQLVPVMAALGSWGRRWLPVTEDLAIRAQVLEEGGAELQERFMAELREEHLGIPAEPSPDGRSVRDHLQDAYLEVVARSA